MAVRMTANSLPRKRTRYSNGHRRREARRLVIQRVESGEPCWICKGQIDVSLPPRHPRALEVDELVPFSRGGSSYFPGNLAPTHRECNEWRGDKSVEEVEKMRVLGLIPFCGGVSAVKPTAPW